jgi:hypothetical protein
MGSKAAIDADSYLEDLDRDGVAVDAPAADDD